MKNEKTQPKAVQGTVAENAEKKEGILTIIPKNENSADDLKKENERLKKMLAKEPKTLQEKIYFFQQKEQFIKQLDVLQKKRDQFLTVQDDLNSEIEEDEFLTNTFAIALTYKKGYNNEESLFKVQNPVLVGELLQFVLGKMSSKIEEIEISIEA
jgi:ribosomal protein S8